MAAKPADRQAIREWDLFFNNFMAEVSADLSETEAQKKERIKRLESNFEEWKKYYFPKYCYAPSPDFHKKSSRYVIEHPECVLVRRWARELAKDILTMIETTYQALTGQVKCVMLISNSYDKAANFLEPYKINLEKNERIINDYGIQQLTGSWTEGAFITAKGVGFYAFGAGQSPRGLRNEEIRPDKVIFTDMDTDEDVRNEAIIDKRWKWSEKAVYATRSVSRNFQIVWLGNTIAKDCCVVRACERADRVEIVNIEDKNGESTWPEKNSKENIQRLRKMFSTAAFEAEYMNNPLAEGSVFKEMIWGKVPPLGKFKFVVNYGDPSPSSSKNVKSSFKSLFLVGFCEGIYYVIDGYLDHATNAEFVEWYYSLHELYKNKVQLYHYVENNSLQDPFYKQVFLPEVKRRGEKLGMIPISEDNRKKKDKYTRIEGNLEPLNRLGKLVLNSAKQDNPHMKRLAEQFLLLQPGLPAPADGPDDIEGAVWIVNEKLSTQSAAGIRSFGNTKASKRV